jgi:hypothetical protein
LRRTTQSHSRFSTYRRKGGFAIAMRESDDLAIESFRRAAIPDNALTRRYEPVRKTYLPTDSHSRNKDVPGDSDLNQSPSSQPLLEPRGGAGWAVAQPRDDREPETAAVKKQTKKRTVPGFSALRDQQTARVPLDPGLSMSLNPGGTLWAWNLNHLQGTYRTRSRPGALNVSQPGPPRGAESDEGHSDRDRRDLRACITEVRSSNVLQDRVNLPSNTLD